MTFSDIVQHFLVYQNIHKSTALRALNFIKNNEFANIQMYAASKLGPIELWLLWSY